jgi:DNA replication protein DnaC
MTENKTEERGRTEPIKETVARVETSIRQESSDSTRTKFQRSSEAELIFCQKCGNTGWVQVEDKSGVAKCECAKKQFRQDRIRVILEEWPKYRDAELETFSPSRNIPGQADAILQLRRSSYDSYLITGGYGTGKTHLMIAQYRFIALAGIKCVLRTARDAVEELRKAYMVEPGGGERFESQILQVVNGTEHGHLFIDDIDKAPARTGFRQEMLFDLFDTIMRRELTLTVTSNYPLASGHAGLQDLRGILGESVAARLHRICKEIKL